MTKTKILTPILDDPQVSIPDVLERHGKYFKNREAVIFGNQRRKWGTFNENINRVANALLRSGVKKGDKVAILMENSVEMLETLFGVVKAGGCAVPLSGMLTGDQLKELLNQSDSVGVIATADFREKLKNHLGELINVRPGLLLAALSLDDGWDDYGHFLDNAPTTPPAQDYSPTDEFNIIFSSGTTGSPKGIVQTHRARLHWAFSNALEMGLNENSRSLTTTPLYSNGTWLMMLPTLFVGGTLVVMSNFEPSKFLEILYEERISHTFMVPTQYQMVLQEPKLECLDFNSLQVLLCAGSSLKLGIKEKVLEIFGEKLIELYGFTEGFASMLKMLKPGQNNNKKHTVGIPVIGFEVKIIDENGTELPPNAVGEIAAYGAGMMKEYYRHPEKTAQLIIQDDRGRTFMRSGDIGSIDEDGFIRIIDRKKDMIISGGFNVFPADIEAILAQHPDVSDVTVIGVTHEKWGEAPLALVIPIDGSQATPSDINEWANKHLAKFQRLKGVEFRNEFPRNALGKVLRRELRKPYEE